MEAGRVDAAEIKIKKDARSEAGSDERVWAALAHGSALFFGFGPILTTVLWFTQRRKSPYAAFHALQSMAYQVVFFWAYLTVVPLLVLVVVFGMMIVGVVLSPRGDPGPWVAIVPQMLMMAVFFGVFGLYELLAVIGVVASIMGRDFKYPILGTRLAQYLQYGGAEGAALDEPAEDRAVAAVCHACCVIPFFGLVTPLAVWLTQQQRSQFLRFQSMQAAIFQAFGLVGYFVMMALYMLSFLGMVATGIWADYSNQSASGPLWMLAFILPLLCIVLVFLLAVPLYHLLGFLGTVRVLRGNDFRYPILGRLLAARMKSAEAT